MKPACLIPLLVVLAAAPAWAGERASVGALLKDAKLDGKEVTVTGHVEEPKQTTSRAGKAYFLFKLSEGKAYVHVFGYGEPQPALKAGQTVTVTGKFARERKVGTRVYKDEIEVLSKGGKPQISGS